MSLVSDALKKAQREAAEREARAKGLAPPPGGGAPPLQPFRRRGRGGAFTPARLAVTAAILVAAAGVAYFFFSPRPGAVGAARDNGSPTPVVAPPVKETVGSKPAGAARFEASGSPHATSANEGEAAVTELAGAAESQQTTASGSTPTSRSDSSNDGTGAAPTQQAAAPEPPPPSLPAFSNAGTGTGTTRQAEAPGAAPENQTASATAGAGAAPVRRAAAPAAPPRRWVREAELGDGAVVRLGGIAYSEAAPLAYLNGRLIGVGEGVEGWTVRAIRRAEVELERGDERAILALR